MKYIVFITNMLVLSLLTTNQAFAAEFDHQLVSAKTSILFTLRCQPNVKYRVQYRVKGTSQLIIAGDFNYKYFAHKCPSVASFRVPLRGLKCGTSYQIRALRLHSGVKERFYNADTLPCVPPGAVRLKHLQTNKCVYTYQHGNSFSTWKVHNWGCWNDPEMAFTIVPAGGGYFKIKDPKSGLCLATSNTNNSRIFLYGCSQNYNGLFFKKDVVGNGKFRLRSKFNQCMFGTPTNGGDVKSWGCWNDPNMEFVFEYY